MPVKRDPDGNRSVEAEVEVPGTPEEVWAAIASGKGISSWFVPTQVEEKVEGQVLANFGPGMDSVSTIKVWEPPHRFVADSRDDMGSDGPTIATEWIVEARDGGKCVVRVVHRWFTEKDDWDGQFEQHTYGWRSFFRILRMYLAYYRGMPSAAFQIMGMAPEPKSEAWQKLTQALGLTNPQVGGPFATSTDAPLMSGKVEHVGPTEHPEELLLRLEQPAPGTAHMFAMPMGGQVFLSVRLFLYGDQAAAAVAKWEPVWQAWISQQFPPAGDASKFC